MDRWHEISRHMVFPWHCDHYGHMNVRWYTGFFDDASFLIWPNVGIDMRAVHATGIHSVIARNTTEYHHEVQAGDPLLIVGGFTRVGSKSLTLEMRMLDATSRDLRASQETVVVFFNAATRRSAEIPENVRAALAGAVAPEADAGRPARGT
jgi:acyl-CoA thioester hydrolase